MKLTGFSRQSRVFFTKPLTTRQIVITVLILIALPFFVFIAITRTEIRKKAASYPPPYNTDTRLVTNDVALLADSFYIKINANYYLIDRTTLTVNSDPTNSPTDNYTTLEATWYDTINGVRTEMRLYMYFQRNEQQWWPYEARIYNTRNPSDWIYFYPQPYQPGYHPERGLFYVDRNSIYQGNLNLTTGPESAIQASIHFRNLRLMPYLRYLPCFSNTYVNNGIRYWLGTVTPLTEAENTLYQSWIMVNSPNIVNASCAYPTPTPTTQPLPTAGPNCIRRSPSFTPAAPWTVFGTNTQTKDIIFTMMNNDSEQCPPTQFFVGTGSLPNGWMWQSQTKVITPQTSEKFWLPITPLSNSIPGIYNISVNISSSGYTPLHSVSLPVKFTVTDVSKSQTFEFKFKFGGVTDGSAEGANVKVHFVTPDENLITPNLPATHIGNGVYKISFASEPLLMPQSKIYFLLKGEKHAAMKFCKSSGQTTRCQPSEWITTGNTMQMAYSFDFTGMALKPGDTNPQDYEVNATDYQNVRTLLSKPCSQLTLNDRLVGDLDYSGCVNVKDIFLIRQTLESAADPS